MCCIDKLGRFLETSSLGSLGSSNSFFHVALESSLASRKTDSQARPTNVEHEIESSSEENSESSYSSSGVFHCGSLLFNAC